MHRVRCCQLCLEVTIIFSRCTCTCFRMLYSTLKNCNKNVSIAAIMLTGQFRGVVQGGFWEFGNPQEFQFWSSYCSQQHTGLTILVILATGGGVGEVIHFYRLCNAGTALRWWNFPKKRHELRACNSLLKSVRECVLEVDRAAR